MKQAGASSALTLLPAWAAANVEALPPLELFFRDAELSDAQLSPDGSHLLALRKIEGKNNLVLIRLADREMRQITALKTAEVFSPMWLNDQRILYAMGTRVDDRVTQAGGLMAVDIDGGRLVALPRRIRFFARGTQAKDGSCIVSSWESEKNHQVLQRLNTFNGKLSRLSAGAPGTVRSWRLDRQDRPRAAITYEPAKSTLWLRAQPDADWQAFASWGPLDNGITLEGIDADERLYVLAQPEGRDEMALMAIDLATASWVKEPLIALKGVDIEPGACRFDAQGRLRSVLFETSRPQVVHLDEKLDALQQAMEKQFPYRTVSLSPSREQDFVLVSVSGAAEPGQLHLYKTASASLEPVGKLRPWLSALPMANTRFFRYAARDGLQIPAMLTLPPNAKPGQRHPLLVLHYGGPHVRAIAWRFDPVVQFLASRGYAVFMPAPRMSTGWGRKHHEAGWKQWGLAMQDDVNDGVLQLVKEGVADRDRLALVGASYGGYLTMMGLVKDPDLWRCGVNWVGVTDPEHMYFSWTDFAGSEVFRHRLPYMLGHPERDKEQFAQTSPLKRVAEIKAPALLAYGADDVRVPLANGRRMHEAMLAAGKQVEYVVYDGEGHGWSMKATNLDFWSRVERFLAQHMAPRAS